MSKVNTFEIYFNDLNPDAKKRLLLLVGASSASEMNWDINIIPLAILEFEEEEKMVDDYIREKEKGDSDE